ncbi:6372_t:CDS:10, partial [Gigaspora margarita]
MSGTSGNNFPQRQYPSNLIDPFDDSETVETSQSTDNLSVPQAAAIPSFRPYFSSDNTSFDPYFNDSTEDDEEQVPLYSESSGLTRQITNMSEANLPLTDNISPTASVGIGEHTFLGKTEMSSGDDNPTSGGERIIYINKPNTQQKFLHNRISTTKYNFFTFLPKFLYEQFSKYANMFFLFTACIQQIPYVSPTNPFTTLGTLIVVLTATAFKEILEDYVSVNQRKCKYLDIAAEAFILKEWNQVNVGDIVRVESGEFFPADLILLSSSEPEATNDTAYLTNPSKTSSLTGYIKSETPNNSLYTYDGLLEMDGQDGRKRVPLDPTQLLLRGAQLRNTSWVYVVKFQQALLINDDLDMYYEKTDTPALCRTSSLVEELGQFKQCSIAGLAYADNVEEAKRARIVDGVEVGFHDFKQLRENIRNHPTGNVINEFLSLLSICHTVIPERKDDNPARALVKGASLLDYVFTTRRPKSVNVRINGVDYEYEILSICEFNSTRKRMSTVVRGPDGKITLYCKGADTVILERLSDDNPFVEQTLQHLEEYATEGLRTLCIAMREVSEEEYRVWSTVYEKASTTLVNRSEELDKAAEMIEKNLFLLGATAIEDKLQDGVPETIHTLQQAGIKIWVLTGDRQETAINIGLSCKLINEEMSLITVNEESHWETKEFLEKRIHSVKGRVNPETEPLALVIDGRTLGFALEKEIEGTFLELATMCKAVICCRVSPLQKALVVKLVKRHLKAILLAIGDGANDVPMIQAAHVGVGISGLEGMQAARSADVSISQFRYLKKLLLVHGAWSYQRLSKLILYSFYKNITLYMTQFWYAFQNGFSGQVIYESWTITYYNVLFTVLPPIVMGVFDQYVSARMLDRYPQLYSLGQKSEFFNVKNFWGWALNAFFHSLILYLLSIYVFQYGLVLTDGQLADHWFWGTALYTAVLATVLGKAALITDLWTKYTYIAIPGSFIFWMVFIFVYGMVAPRFKVSEEYDG